MSSNTENTEAKLAAYIDGQLDPAERAQIEQYLQANPEHRKLLADMMAQREVLRSLPREKAPSDVYDAIQAQLERSVLLDDSAQSAAPAVRHSRRSQLFGIAAILLLAAGLGVVLYIALPPTKPHPIDVAGTGMPAGAAASQPTTVATADGGEGAAPDLSTSIEEPAKAKHRRTKGGPAAGQAYTSATPNAEAMGQMRDLSKAAAAGPVGRVVGGPDQLVLLVSSNDPSEVNQQVESYLQANNIRWEAIHAPAGQQVLYSRTGAGAPPARPSQKAEAAAPAQEHSEITPPTPDEARPNAATTADAARQIAPSPPGAPAPAEGVTTPPPAAQDVSQEQQEQQEKLSAVLPSENGERLSDSPPTTRPQIAALYRYSPAAADKAAPRPYIVARGMTRAQAIELTDALSADRTTRRARLIGQFPGRSAVIVKGLEVRSDEFKHLPAQAVPQTQPTTDPTLSVTTAPLHVTTAPTAVPEALPAATEPVFNAGKEAAAATRQPGAPATAAATTAPTTVATLAEQTPPPTTAPARPVTPTLDVVILVEDDSPFSTTVPTSAPSPATSQPAPASQPAPLD